MGASIASINATDPEGSAVTYTLSGTGSDNFSIDTSGNITLASALDYETATSYELTVVVDDGTSATTEVITVSVADVNEAPSLSANVAFNAFQENTATGTTIATSSVTDPEAGAPASGSVTELVAMVVPVAVFSWKALKATFALKDGASFTSATLTVITSVVAEVPSSTTTVNSYEVAVS